MATATAKRWAAYRRMSDGTGLLLGTVEAEGEKPAIKAAMETYSLPWRAIAVRVANLEPLMTIRCGKPSNPRPWDGADLVRHELSAMFPDMHQDTYARLLDSVREHGAVKPVVLHEGAVLDGWHRYRAYRDVGVEFHVEDWDGEYGTPLAFVVAENLARRDLTPSQRATLAVEVKKRLNNEYRDRSIANLKRGDEAPEPRVVTNDNSGGDARKEAAATFRVSAGLVHDAEQIKEKSPETFEAVKQGEKSVYQAKQELGLSKPKAETAPAPKPVPEPKAPPRTLVNGVAKEDAAVERARAEGRIPEGVEVEVEEPEVEVDLEVVREEVEERQAKVDADQTDEEWLATLPLDSELSGVSLDVFRRDALLWRRLRPACRAYAKAAARELKESRKGTRRSLEGWFATKLRWHLGVADPSRWTKCPPVDQGGCAGTGRVELIGPCAKCKERGYLVR